MAKRPAEIEENEIEALKDGDRPSKTENREDLEYEDEFEDEFESEDEIFEAGVNGQPDADRELDERRGTWKMPVGLCEHLPTKAYRTY